MTKQKSKKLDYIKVGLFLIKEVRGLVNYKLQLLSNIRRYQVFYISILKLVDAKIPLQEIFYYQDIKDQKYEVEEILERKGQKYLIK